MPTIFEQLEETAEYIKQRFNHYEKVNEGRQFAWPNYVYRGPNFRRAHLDIVDARETKKLYMFHLTVFPHTNNPAPIFGFDLIAGPNKVTGAFHDFSPIGEHPLNEWFASRVAGMEWSKERELPEWAKNIFSKHMVAAGNIQTEEELSRVLYLMRTNLNHYLEYIGEGGKEDFTEKQNWYCHNQKQNPHTPRVMTSLGLDPDEVKLFIETCLFPEKKEHDSSVINMLAGYGYGK